METMFWYVAPAILVIITFLRSVFNPFRGRQPRIADKYTTRKVMGFTIRTKGFPLAPKNVVSVSGPHLFLPWKKVYYYERNRRQS